MTTPIFIYGTDAATGIFPVGWWSPRFLFHFNNGPAAGFARDGRGMGAPACRQAGRRSESTARTPIYYIGETMKELSFHEKKKIRNRLLAIYRENGKVTERDLLRLSALTGVNYSIIVEIHQSTHYQPLHGLKDYVKGKIANNK